MVRPMVYSSQLIVISLRKLSWYLGNIVDIRKLSVENQSSSLVDGVA